MSSPTLITLLLCLKNFRISPYPTKSKTNTTNWYSSPATILESCAWFFSPFLTYKLLICSKETRCSCHYIQTCDSLPNSTTISICLNPRHPSDPSLNVTSGSHAPSALKHLISLSLGLPQFITALSWYLPQLCLIKSNGSLKNHFNNIFTTDCMENMLKLGYLVAHTPKCNEMV